MTKRFQILDLNEYTMKVRCIASCPKDALYRQFHISKTKQYALNGINDIPDQIMKDNIVYITFPITDYASSSHPNINILYQDPCCMLIYKPGFLLVHDDGNAVDSLQDRVNAYLLSTGWPHAAQAVQRIDYEASGLVLFCINPFFQACFDRMISTRKIRKEYQCVVKGIFPWISKTIAQPIGRDRHNAKAMRISAKGKPAVSKVTRLMTHRDTTLLNVRILTGRKHQIRVHLSSIGYPIVNDRVYGTVKNKDGLLLQCVHTAFIHPVLHIPVDIQCPPDQRMK